METITFTISNMATVVSQITAQLDTNIALKLMFGITSTMTIREWYRVVVMVTTSLVYTGHRVIWFIVLRSLCAVQ